MCAVRQSSNKHQKKKIHACEVMSMDDASAAILAPQYNRKRDNHYVFLRMACCLDVGGGGKVFFFFFS